LAREATGLFAPVYLSGRLGFFFEPVSTNLRSFRLIADLPPLLAGGPYSRLAYGHFPGILGLALAGTLAFSSRAKLGLKPGPKAWIQA
jgi:hypothetical protein